LSYKENQDIINAMVKVKSSSVYFDLCYVYYFEDKKVLDLNKLNAQLRDANEIDNKSLLEEARKLYFMDSNSGKPFIFSKIQMDKETNALVLVKPVDFLDENPSAIIVMTLKPSFFTDLMNKTSLNPKANVYILDDSGKVIMSNNELHYFNEDNRQFSVNEKGYFKGNIEGEQYLIMYLNSRKLGWRYIYLIPVNEIFNKIKFVQLIIIVVSVLCLSIGLLLSFIFAKSLYKPVLSLRSLFGDDLNQEVVKDDIGYIGNSIKKLITENTTLEDLLQESMPVMKNMILRSLLSNSFDDEERLRKSLKFHNANITEGCYYNVSVIRADQYHMIFNDYSERQIEMLQIYQRELIYGVCSGIENINIEVVNMDELFIALIFSLNFQDEKQAEEQLTTAVKKIHSTLSNDVKFTFTVGIGSLCNSLGNIHLSYHDAVLSYDYKVIKGNNSIISIKDVPLTEGYYYRYPARIEKLLLSYLKQADGNMAMKALNDYFAYIRDNVNDYRFIKYSIIRLFDTTFGCVSEMPIDVNLLFPDEKDLHTSLLLLDTLEDAQRWFEGIYNTIIGYINDRKENKEAIIVGKIREYIDKNYMYEDISLSLLADEMQYSIPYMEKLFKDMTGKPIKEYITEKRIEEAKRLLETGNLKIWEIGEKVGYKNVKSFTSIFKKYQGESPSEYRSRYVKKIY